MSLLNVFDIAGSTMRANSIRLNTTASNLANANNIATSKETAYRAKMPVFTTGMSAQKGFKDLLNQANGKGVQVAKILESNAPARQEYMPNHPFADEKGYVYLSNVEVMAEMANMIAASRAYQTSVEVMKTAKQMMLNTLRMGE